MKNDWWIFAIGILFVIAMMTFISCGSEHDLVVLEHCQLLNLKISEDVNGNLICGGVNQ